MKAVKDFFSVILRGESRTYDDHNWYVQGNSLRGYIRGVHSNRYPLLNKNLSEYSLGEIKQFQQRPRDVSGQLWATGRYQIIPTTLRMIQNRVGVPDTAIYNPNLQDAFGLALLYGRPNVKAYLEGSVSDTKQNREMAALDLAKEWSSVGVPFEVMGGRGRMVLKNQSYYTGGGDRASVSTEDAQNALQKLRREIIATGISPSNTGGSINITPFVISGVLLISAAAFIFYAKNKIKSK